MIKKPIRSILSKIRHSDWEQHYAEIKALTTREEIISFQEKYLRNLLLHAYQNVPYYNKIFKEIGIVKDSKVHLSEFSEIPILTKEVIKEHQEQLISKDYTTRKWYSSSTGGSTGEPTRFMQDGVYDEWGRAALYYYYKDILGIDEPNVKKVILWGSERDLFQGGMGWKARIVNWLTDTVFLNSFKMTEDDMEHYLRIINSYKPELIRGYAVSLYELCRYAERKGIEVHTPRFVVSSAETLTAEMRQEIEKIFRTKVYNFYGSRETNNLAGECGEGLMHILAFHNYIEMLNDGNESVQEGDEGRIVVTNLHNYSMPFIRYDIGDMAVLGPEKCKCGNPLPTLKEVTGRISDYFVKDNGTIILLPTHLFFFKDWAKAFQIIQEDYKRVRILVVLSDKVMVNESEKTDIEDKIKLLMGDDCQVVWDFVDEIPKTAQGKYFYRKSLIRR